MKIVIAVLGFLTLGLFAQESNVAQVSFLIGKVSIKQANETKWKSLKKDDSIQNGDTIMTGNGSAATITYKGSEFKVSPNSTFVVNNLHSKDKDGNVEVKNGGVWFKIVDLGGKKFTATTPTSTAGVRGTAFGALYDTKSKTAMHCVCEGKIEVSSKSGDEKPKLIEKGKGSSLKMGSSDIDLNSYKDLIVKKEAMPEFEAKVKESPILNTCLSCHTPKGWTAKGIVKDEKYGQ